MGEERPVVEYTPTYHDQLVVELNALFDQFIAKLPYLEHPPESRQEVYGYLSIPEEFRNTAVAAVAESEALQAVQRLQVEEARETQQFTEAFRPLARRLIAAGEALEYTIDVKLSRLNRGALRIYAIAKELERDRAELGAWIGEMKEHLKRRTQGGRRRKPEPSA
jgi:hypothetical protein